MSLEALGDADTARVLATYARQHGDDPALVQGVFVNEWPEIISLSERIAAEKNDEREQLAAAMTSDDVLALVWERLAAHTVEP